MIVCQNILIIAYLQWFSNYSYENCPGCVVFSDRNWYTDVIVNSLSQAERGNMYDLIIIGSGPAGLGAAVYGKRAGLSTLVIEKNPMSGGQVLTTYEVDIKEMARKTINNLIKKMNHESYKQGISIVEGHMVIKDSVAKRS